VDIPDPDPDVDKKTRRPKSAPPVAPAADAGTDEVPLSDSTVAQAVPQWLRFTGQQATVFPGLGGEVEPGAVVRPGGGELTVQLLARGDFTAARAPEEGDSAPL
jgi:hypothetical protein